MCRWTMGPRYSMSTLQLESNVYTREQFVRVTPSKPIDMNSMPFPDPRARLAPEAAIHIWTGTLVPSH